MLRDYYRLAKPGIVYGNALVAFAAFLFASRDHVALSPLLGLLGLLFVIGAACVINNIIDRDIDARMDRTKTRALVAGRISVGSALWFAATLALLGFGLLMGLANPLAALVALAGVIIYLALYTPAKRRTPYSTIIGAFSGAVPPLVGYAAATGTLDAAALVLFLCLICWQMTHFFAIGIFRADDYRAAGLPIMPLALGHERTKLLMVVYAVLFALAALALPAVRAVGLPYLLLMIPLCLGWIGASLYGYISSDERLWARRVFLYSLVVLLGWCLALAIP